MKITKMPFEQNTVILSNPDTQPPLTLQELNKVEEWLHESKIEYTMYRGGILSFHNSKHLSWFLLNWLGK